jgi:probable aminopeptidase NPEPL1
MQLAHQHLDPSYIIDMATLAGAKGVATGKSHAGIYTNDGELEKMAVRSGKASNDLVHPMPYVCAEFNSKFADMTK